MSRDLHERLASSTRVTVPAGQTGLAPVASHATARPPRRPMRRAVVAISALLIGGGVVAVSQATESVTVPPGIAPWTVALYSDGAEPVTAVVYTQRSGMRMLRLPVGSPQQNVVAGLGADITEGSVYVLSLGRGEVRVSAATGSEGPSRGFGTHGRLIRLTPARADAQAGAQSRGSH